MKNVQKIDLGLTGYDELFANDEERKVNKLPRIFDIPISEIRIRQLHKIRTLFDRGSVPSNRVPAEKQRLQVVKSERTLYAESETKPSKQRSGRNTRLSSPPVLQEGRL